MDPGARIYAGLLACVSAHLSRVNPKFAETATEWATKSLNEKGVVFGLQNSVITVAYAEEKHREVLYDSMMSIAEAFERQYGVNEVWMPLKQTIIRYLQTCRDEVRELGIEVPISKYTLDYTVLDSLFGFNATDFRSRKWIKDPLVATNQKITLMKESGIEEIPYAKVATVDREIYIGYSSESIKGEIRAIDYQSKQSGMSCIVFLAKKDVMRDFMKVVSVMRAEYRRLNTVEGRVLIALNNNVKASELARAVNVTQAEADKAFRRIVEIGYADPSGRLTSYGINMAIEIIRAVRQ